MKVELKRVFNCPTYCIGHLYVDGKYVCDTIEDTDRGLDQKMSLSEILKRKVKKQTAIPTGRYQVSLRIQSPTFSKKSYYMSFCKGYLPRLLDVSGYGGILMHRGVNQNNTEGCIIVGYNTIKGQVTNSQKAFEELYNILMTAKEAIYITITRKYKVAA